MPIDHAFHEAKINFRYITPFLISPGARDDAAKPAASSPERLETLAGFAGGAPMASRPPGPLAFLLDSWLAKTVVFYLSNYRERFWILAIKLRQGSGNI